MTIEALPVRSTYHPDEQPQVEIRGLPEPGTLRVFHLGEPAMRRHERQSRYWPTVRRGCATDS